jgi:hypothetical protein
LRKLAIKQLRHSNWLEEYRIPDQRVDYIVAAIPAAPWGQLDVSGPERFIALPRHSDSTLLYVAKLVHLVRANPSSIAVALVYSPALSTGSASSGEARLRRWLVESGLLHSVVQLPVGVLEQTSVAPALVILRAPDSGADDAKFCFVDASNLGRRRDQRKSTLNDDEISSITSALMGGESPMRHVISHRELEEDERWRIPPTFFRSGEVQEATRVHAWEQPLGDMCEVLPGRNRSLRGAQTSDGPRVIPAGAIGADLTLAAWDELPISNPPKSSSVWVEPGDIIGSISPPYGRWSLIPDDYRPALASDHTVVLRRRSDSSMRYLLEYLNSERARALIGKMFRGSVIQRLDRNDLARLPVPECPLAAPYVDTVLATYRSELSRLGRDITKLCTKA